MAIVSTISASPTHPLFVADDELGCQRVDAELEGQTLLLGDRQERLLDRLAQTARLQRGRVHVHLSGFDLGFLTDYLEPRDSADRLCGALEPDRGS